MRRVLVSAILVLAGPAAAARSNDGPGPFQALAGTWVRPLGGLTTAKDGKTDVLAHSASVP